MNRRQFAQLAPVCLALMFAPFVVWNSFAQSGVIRVIVGVPGGGAIDPYARISPCTCPRRLASPSSSRTSPAPAAPSPRSTSLISPPTAASFGLAPRPFVEINPNLFKNVHWSIDQFHPIIRGIEAPLVFVVHPSVPASSFADFVKWAKENKGKLSYSSYQSGTPSHFLGFQLNERFRS